MHFFICPIFLLDAYRLTVAKKPNAHCRNAQSK
nr:MAG TPA: hypothetical protein [Caudoviricetes sp.]